MATVCKCLDFLVGKIALFGILHHQHAGHITAAQNRHADKAQIRVFAGFRTIGKARMRRRIGQIKRAFMLGNITDQTLANMQHGLVHRIGVQPFCRA